LRAKSFLFGKKDKELLKGYKGLIDKKLYKRLKRRLKEKDDDAKY